MSQAKLLFDSGQLGEAIEELTVQVKGNPTNIGMRTFLFELLSFAGDWDRAERQLDVIGHQSVEASIGVEVYRQNLKAERMRHRVFCEGIAPNFLVDPPSYVNLLLAATYSVRHGNHDEARQLLDQVEAERPQCAGKINDRPFQDFRDCDALTGPVLELVFQGKYSWLPFEQIKRIEVVPPRNLRDLLWTNARIEAADGTVAEVFLPTLYFDSSAHANDQVKLGRMTEWKAVGPALDLAAGLRLFIADNDEKTVLEMGSIEFANFNNHVSQPAQS